MIKAEYSPSEKIPLYKPNELPKIKTLSAKGLQALRVIKKYSLFAGATGLIPSPFIGQAVVTAHLIALLNDLNKLYGLSFSDHQVKIIVTAILGGAHSEWISFYLKSPIGDL